MITSIDLRLLLVVAALGQFTIAILNLFLERLLRWKEDIARMPLLIREVFQVHSWFISATLAIFAVLTLRFAPQMASGADALASWLAASIGMFWAVRAVMQVTYYSSSHWRGRMDRTIIHIILLLAYGGMAAAYLIAGLAR